MIDEYIYEPVQGKLFAIKGGKQATSMMLISLAEKLQYKRVLFIDAAHCFNQFFVSKFHHKKKINLERIYIARPFTLDQFKSIINNLKKELVKRQAKAIIISGFDRFLTEHSVSDQDCFFYTEQLLEELRAITNRFDCVTILSIADQTPIEEMVIKNVQLCTSV